MSTETAQDPDQIQRRAGFANWQAYHQSGRDLGLVLGAAKGWARHFAGIDKPWLCWNVNDDWCWVQQQMVAEVGWTPVIGYDPRVGAPKRVHPSAVVVNFNEGLDFPTLHPVFPMEFVWLYAPRLAFWHSDLIVRPDTMRKIVSKFERMANGETIAVDPSLAWSRIWSKYKRRYWELIGCTTRDASQNQFERGSGWWRHIQEHPNCPPGERAERSKYFWDHGVGIRYWARNYGGSVSTVPERWVEEGHCTQINNPQYVRVTPNDDRKNMSLDLVANYRLDDVCRRLDRANLLPPQV